jgi:hypothetical protein
MIFSEGLAKFGSNILRIVSLSGTTMTAVGVLFSTNALFGSLMRALTAM